MKAFFLALIAVALSYACAGPPTPAKSTAQSDAKATSDLPQTANPVSLKCGGQNFSATYTTQTRAMPATIELHFTGRRPTSAVVESASRKCLQLAIDTLFLTSETATNAWYDDDLVPLLDSSDHLYCKPGQQIISEYERFEQKPPTYYEHPGKTYFVEETLTRRAVAPFDTFRSLSVIFRDTPSDRLAIETLIVEMKRVSASNRIETIAFVQTGRRDDPAGWQQVRGSNGKFISGDFDPKRGSEITSDGRNLGPTALIP